MAAQYKCIIPTPQIMAQKMPEDLMANLKTATTLMHVVYSVSKNGLKITGRKYADGWDSVLRKDSTPKAVAKILESRFDEILDRLDLDPRFVKDAKRYNAILRRNSEQSRD